MSGYRTRGQHSHAFDAVDELNAGTDGYVLTWSDSDGFPIWAPGGGATPHDLLDGDQNQDTLAGTVTAGDIIIGNSTPKWARLAKSTDGKVLTLASGLPSWQTPNIKARFYIPFGSGLPGGETYSP